MTNKPKTLIGSKARLSVSNTPFDRMSDPALHPDFRTVDFADVERRVLNFWPRRAVLDSLPPAIQPPRSRVQRVFDRIAKQGGFFVDLNVEPMSDHAFALLRFEKGVIDVRQAMQDMIAKMIEASGSPSGRFSSRYPLKMSRVDRGRIYRTMAAPYGES